MVTLTGLGLKFSSIIIAYAGGSVLLTTIYTALIVRIIGLAVPVTASYIISVVICAPAMIQLGIPVAGGLTLVYPEPLHDLVEFGLLAAVIALQKLRREEPGFFTGAC